MKRFEEIDFLKGFCMILVFFQHSILYFPIDFTKEYHWCWMLSHAIGSFFMPCFFLVSGFLFSKSTKSWNTVMKDKLYRILVPYVFVCAITFSVKLCVPQLAFGSYDSLGEYAKYYLLYGGDRWFLYVLFVIFLFVAPLKQLLQKNIYWVIGLLIMLFFLYYNSLLPYEFLLSKSCYMGIFFISGFVVREYYCQIKNFILKYKWEILLVSLFVNGWLFSRVNIYVLMYIVPYVGILGSFSFAFIILERARNLVCGFISRALAFVGVYSLQFYLFTGFVLVVARTFVIKILSFSNPIYVIPLVFFIQMVLATLGVFVCKKVPLLKKAMGY